MDRVADKLQSAFQALQKGKWDLFVRYFMQVICYLEVKLQFTEETVKRLVQTLHLTDKNLHLEENPDGTHTIYSDKRVLETYRVSEVLAWIWRQFLQDPLLCNDGEIVEVERVVSKLENMTFPSGWDAIYKKILEKNAKYYVINDDVYYFKTTPESGTVLMMSDSLWNLVITDSKKEVVLKGVEPKLFYARDMGHICCKLSGKNAYITYHPSYKMVLHEQEGTLIGVNANGTEWFWNEERILCSYSGNCIQEYEEEPLKHHVCVEGKGVKFLPYLDRKPVLPAYYIECGGRKMYSQEDHNERKWAKMMLLVMFDLDFGEGDFEQQVNREKFFRKPHPFTWKEIEKHIKQQPISPENMEKVRCVFEDKMI